MFQLFPKQSKRITIKENGIFINNQKGNIGKSIDTTFTFEFTQPISSIQVFENDQPVRDFVIESLKKNPNLTGQFLHSSVRIQPNSAVMIDGIISDDSETYSNWTADNYEALRLQPFYLSNHDSYNSRLIGKGLFERGLHYVGTVTPRGVRCICICDNCRKSFAIQHIHAGFSEAQYFYSADSKDTLMVPYNVIQNMPAQLQKYIDPNILSNVEALLPDQSKGFRYYNSFNCPHCSVPYIDFNKHKEIRPDEYTQILI